jgi:hypothetical protein
VGDLRTLSFSSLYGSELVVLDVINGDGGIIVLVALDTPRCITLWTVASQEISRLLYRRALRNLHATLLSACRRPSYGHRCQWVEMVSSEEPILLHLLCCKAEQPKESLHEERSSRHPMAFKITQNLLTAGQNHSILSPRLDESRCRKSSSPPCVSQQSLVA